MSNFPTIIGPDMDIAAAVQKSQIKSADVGGVSHIKYDPYSGDWRLGKEADLISDFDVTIITNTITHGWHLWVDREVEKDMVTFLEELPKAMSPRENRQGKTQYPTEARGVQMVLDDEDGVQLSWEHSTVGCKQAIDALMTAIRSRSLVEPDYLYPFCRLSHGTPYANKHKDGEMLFPPLFEILGWCNKEGVKFEETAKIAAPEAATPEPEEADDPQEATTRRRRRREG